MKAEPPTLSPSPRHHTLPRAPALALALAATLPAGCGAPLAMNAQAHLRAGRLVEACRAAFFGSDGDRQSVDAEVRRRAPVRARLRVLSGPSDPAWPAPPPLALRNGSLATFTTEVPVSSIDDGALSTEVLVPRLVTSQDAGSARRSSALLTQEMGPALAHWLALGTELPGSGQTPGVLLDAIALLLSAGMVDPRLRNAPPPPPRTEPLPPAVQALLRPFDEQRARSSRCVTDGTLRCSRLLALVPDERGSEPTRVVLEARWYLTGSAGSADCHQQRVVAVPLPPGATLAERLNAAFAEPVDLATAPMVQP